MQTGKRETERLLPRVIVLEDLHWIDSGSWELAVDICKLVPGLLVCLLAVVFDCLFSERLLTVVFDLCCKLSDIR